MNLNLTSLTGKLKVMINENEQVSNFWMIWMNFYMYSRILCIPRWVVVDRIWLNQEGIYWKYCEMVKHYQHMYWVYNVCDYHNLIWGKKNCLEYWNYIIFLIWYSRLKWCDYQSDRRPPVIVCVRKFYDSMSLCHYKLYL